MAKKAVITGNLRVSKQATAKRADLHGDAKFLENSPAAVNADLATTIELTQFRQVPQTLSRQERLRLIEQALLMIDENYVNLPLKKAMHAVNPIQQLRLLQNSTRNLPDAELPIAADFHRNMIEIFMSMRDLHTNYILPSPYNSMTAFLPFLIEPFHDGGRRRYLVSHVTITFQSPKFEKGVEVVAWNGIPIDRAVEINGNRYAGSNLEARHARGVETLTVRPLIINLPPDENVATISFIALDNSTHDLKIKWLVFQPTSPSEISPVPVSPDDARMAFDIESEAASNAKRILFAPDVVQAERNVAMGALNATVGADNLPTSLPRVFQARTVDSAGTSFGYLRIRTFAIEPTTFIPEVIRLIQQLPESGLIIDVRGNGGGYIESGERMLQLFTAKQIEPEPVQFINSSTNLRVCERHAPSAIPGWSDFDLSPFLNSMRDALRTGSIFSNGVPLTPLARANEIGQIYHGPTVLITDGLCFSTTDIFAAGYQDHDIGPILGVHKNTGAGGANVWTHSLLKQLFDLPSPEPNSPFKPLPGNAGLRVAIRRTLRVGKRAGTPVEDLGVTPDLLHKFTRNDLLSRNVDLISRAVQILSGLPKRRLNVTVANHTSTEKILTVDVLGLDRVDIFGDGRPEGSSDVTDGETEVILPNRDVSIYQVLGYKDNSLVAARRVKV